jgi:hypothetical protein
MDAEVPKRVSLRMAQDNVAGHTPSAAEPRRNGAGTQLPFKAILR